MDTLFQREAEELIRGPRQGTVLYDGALSRYGELRARLDWECRPGTPGDIPREVALGLLLRVESTIQRLYTRVFTVVSVEIMEVQPSGSELQSQLFHDASVGWLDALVASQREEPARFRWSGRRYTALFEGAEAAVAFGRAVLGARPDFNARTGMGNGPLQLRIGVHSGPILPSDGPERFGVGDCTAERALELQESAGPDEMIVSAETRALLHEER